MLVGRGATAQQSQRFVAGIPKLVFAAGRNGNGVTGFHVACFAFDANPSRAVGDVINFLGFDVIMFLRARAGRQTRFRQALVANDGIAMRQQFTDFRTVLRDEGRCFVEIFDVHNCLIRSRPRPRPRLLSSFDYENEDEDEDDFKLKPFRHSKHFRPIGLPQHHSGDNQNHCRPKRGREWFMQKEPCPGHRAQGNEIVEQHDLARAPMTERVVPERVGNHAAEQDAECQHTQTTGVDGDAAHSNFSQPERHQPNPRHPHRVRRDFHSAQAGA